MIGTIGRTNAILNKYNLRAKKNFGQNFLIDPNVLKKIVESAELSMDDGVIEIGPGIGALTEVLLMNAKKVLAYEIDPAMTEVLKAELAEYQNLLLKQKDFLKADLKSDLDYFSDCKRVLVISNLPYYITTPIIFRLLSEDTKISEMIFMVQKEVADRLTSKPDTKDYNALSVLMDYKTDSRIVFSVSRMCFIPEPKVDSAVIRILKKNVDLHIQDEARFLKFIQDIFIQRRKTLTNNLSAAYNIPKEEIIRVLNSLGFDERIRSEALTLTEISNIYKMMFEAPK